MFDIAPVFPRVAHQETAGATGRVDALSRLYGDPIEVWTRDGEPSQFVWRDRLYVVRRVSDHWVVAREWWKTSETDPGERRFWRVEADAGEPDITERGGESPMGTPGTYELRFDTASGGWLMIRAWD
jgi:hypothetical protein